MSNNEWDEGSFDIVPADARYQIEQYKNMVDEVALYVGGMEIANKDDAKQALDIACEAINLRERIDAKRKEITEPSKKFQGEINRISNEFLDTLDEVKETVISRVGDWKLGSGEVAKLETPMATTVEMDDFSYEVIDPMIIPKEYLTVDSARVKLAMKQGIRTIPGINVTKSTKMQIRRR